MERVVLVHLVDARPETVCLDLLEPSRSSSRQRSVASALLLVFLSQPSGLFNGLLVVS